MEKYCKTCGKKYYVKPKDFEHSSYCSRKCMADDYKKILIGDKNPNEEALQAVGCAVYIA